MGLGAAAVTFSYSRVIVESNMLTVLELNVIWGASSLSSAELGNHGVTSAVFQPVIVELRIVIVALEALSQPGNSSSAPFTIVSLPLTVKGSFRIALRERGNAADQERWSTMNP